jgi:diguanylate cyclase (GGDEF)-like protein
VTSTGLDSHMAAEILSAVGAATYVWTVADDTLMFSNNAGEVLGWPDLGTSLRGEGFARLIDTRGGPGLRELTLRGSRLDHGDGVAYQIEYMLKPAQADGVPIWIEDTGRWTGGLDGRPREARGMIRVVTARREREEKLSTLARIDELSGQLNRNHLTNVLADRLDQALADRSAFAFLIVAIDGLARINDVFGFDVADEAIAVVGQRLRATMRGPDQIGRFSGNKFGILLRDCTPEQMEVAAERFRRAVRGKPVETTAGPIPVTLTVGGVIAPRHASSIGEVVSRAQDALNIARSKRTGSFHAFVPNPERELRRVENIRTTDEIVAALNDRRIGLAFQPIVDTSTRVARFHECLMRIRATDGRIIPAGAIVPIAEQLGLVQLIDHRVLELAVAELYDSPHARLSVNVSAASAADEAWSQTLAALVRGRPDVATRLIVEITESKAIDHLDEIRGFVQRTKKLGCEVAIDDFGAGYTSFRNLRRLDVDLVKIDGAFVENMLQSPDDKLFVQSLLGLANGLGIGTVAEWVQDEATASLLAEWGCTGLQGRLTGMAAEERQWLDAPKAPGLRLAGAR